MAVISPNIVGARIQPKFIRTYRAPFASGAEGVLTQTNFDSLLSVAAGIFYLRAVQTKTLTRIEIWAAANLAGGAATFDVNLNGVSIFASPADRPVMSQSGNYVSKTVAQAVISGDLITVDADHLPTGGIIAPVVLKLTFS